MDDIDDMYIVLPINLYDFLCMGSRIRSPRLSRKEDRDILHINVVIRDDREDILFYDSIGLCIYRDDDDMFEVFSSFFEPFIIGEIFFLHRK